MASSAVSRKTANYSANASKLDNNLDLLLEDLQTSVSKPGTNYTCTTPTSNYNKRDYTTTETIRKSPLRSISPLSSISPTNAVHTTVEKYVSTGPAGSMSGIPGLEMLDAELQDVQPGQSKTVAYKQVSYHYDKQQEGKDLEPWSESLLSTKNDTSILDEFCERKFDDSHQSSSKTIRETSNSDYGKSGQEIIYKADVTTKTIPAVQPTIETRSTTRDHKFIKETRSRTEPSPITTRKNLKTVRTDETEELTNVEYIPPNVPANLAPGPNTKVTTTVKTYTYELPGAPESYVTNTTTKNIDKSVSYHVDEQKTSGIREYIVPSPSSTSTVHKEQKKIYLEEHRNYRPVTPVQTRTVTSRNEQYHQSNGFSPRPVDVTDHSTSINKSEKVIYYEKEPVIPVNESSTRTTVKQYEEFYSNKPPKAASTPYYPTTSETHSSKNIYKYSDYRIEDSHPKPFPTSERPSSPQQPPRRLEDLMASFTDTEEVLQVKVDRQDHHKVRESSVKKEVEFVPHSPPQVRSRNVAGPPVYYPPGSGEFTRKEESMAAMSNAGGMWAKERGSYEYGSSEKTKHKEKQRKAVVPVCLPLCCALPCSII